MILAHLRNYYQKMQVKYGNLNNQITAIKADAKEAANQLTNLTGSDWSVDAAGEELKDTLNALEKRYQEIKTELTENRQSLIETENNIKTCYDTNLPVDWRWKLVFKDNAIYKGWGGTYETGLEFWIDRVLCQPELEVIKRKISPYIRVDIDNTEDPDWYRLKIMYPAYRNSCWTDYTGEEIFKKLRDFFDPGDIEFQDWLGGLEVLK